MVTETAISEIIKTFADLESRFNLRRTQDKDWSVDNLEFRI